MTRGCQARAATLIRRRCQLGWTQEDLAANAGVGIASVRRAERGERLYACTLEALARCLGLDPGAISFVRPDTAGAWWVPRSPSSFFVGRVAALRRLEGWVMDSPRRAAPIAIHGAVGVGKSELALQLLYCHRQLPASVLWLDCRTPETSLGALRKTASLLRVRNPPGTLLRLGLEVRSALDDLGDWIVVLDGLSGPDSWWHGFRDCDAGRLLITTVEASLCGPHGRGMPLAPLSTAEARDLLMLRSKRIGQHLGSNSTATNDAQEREAASELARSLGCLPGDLDSVAAYAAEHRCSLRTYLATRPVRRRRPASRGSVAPWKKCLDALESESSELVDSIRLLSVGGVDVLPRPLMAELASRGGGFDETDAFWEPALRYSILSRVSDGYQFASAARHAVCRSVEPEQRRQLERRFLELMKVRFSAGSVSDRAQLAAHARVALDYGRRFRDPSLAHAQLARDVGVYALQLGTLSDARLFLARAARLLTHAEGGDDTGVAKVENNLGVVHDRLGEYREAKRCFSRAERKFNAVSESGLRCSALANLAVTAMNLKGYGLARKCLRLSREENTLSSSGAQESLWAVFHEQQGRYQEALECHRKLQAANAAESDIVRANRANNLGKLLLRMARHDDAEERLRLALALWRRTVGKWHPDTATTMNNLAELCLEIGLLDEGELLCEEARQIREAVLPANHRFVALSIINLGRFRAQRGDRRQAFDRARRAAEILDQAGYHPEVTWQVLCLVKLLGRRSEVAKRMLDLAAAVELRHCRARWQGTGPTPESAIASWLAGGPR